MNHLRSTPVIVGLLVLIALCAAGLKLEFFGTTHSGDYDTYVETAQYLMGEHVIPSSPYSIPQRLLKPFAPLLVAGLSTVMDFHTALLTQSVVLYLALVVALYLLAYEFFGDTRRAAYVVLLSALSYPVLKYGIDVYTETGALFFYVLSLYFTLRFSKAPTWSVFAANIVTVTLGFLWKEYSVVSGIIFGFVILFHPDVSWKKKSAYISLFAALVAVVSVPIQVYVLRAFDFSFLTWFTKGGSNGFGYEFTLKNIVKSTAALLGLAWLLVPSGLMRLQALDAWKRRFLYAALPVPLMGFAWGYVSSRLLYVIAIPYVLVAILGLSTWNKHAQYVFVALAIIADCAWLFLSYRITL